MERWNPYENLLNVSNVGDLGLKWSEPTSFFVESSPAVANGVVYVGSDDGNVYALNATTGAKLWNFTTGSDVLSSPAVANGVVYVGSGDDNVYALNATTGAKLWSFTTGGEVYSSPAVVNGVVYVGSFDDNVYALNATTGAKLWSFTTGSDVYSSPAVANGVVYVGSGDDNVYALNAKTGAKLWSYGTGSNNVSSSPAVANGVVYVGSFDDNVYALNATTGAKLWSFTTGSYVFSSPAVASGVVYVGSNDNNVYALNASTGTELWSYTTGGAVVSGIAVANGVVYVGSLDFSVYALNASSGAKLWSYATGSRVDSSPAVANGMLYVTSWDDNVYAFSTSISTSSLVVAPNVGCNSLWGPCSGNIVLANAAETTSLTAIVTPPQQAEITLSTTFGQVGNIATGSSGHGTGSCTAGTLSFGWNDTTTVPGIVSGTIGSQQFPSLTQIFNYAAFDFHQAQVTDVEFTDTNAMSATDIQSFLEGRGSFMSELVIISDQGGFIDKNGNGKLDKGEDVYVSSPPQECKAPCGPFPLGSTGTLASSVFENAATTYGVNPEVLLDTAEKENSLVVAGKLPGVGVLNWAMGCGKASDFLSQINCSANTFAIQFGLTPSEPFFLREPKFNVQHYVTGIGLQVVAFQIQTAATYAQYRYTPFIQTSATGGGVYLFESIWAAYGF